VKHLVVCLGLALAGLAFSPLFTGEGLILAADQAQIGPGIGSGVVAGSQGGSTGPATGIVNTAGGNASAGSHGVNVSPQTNVQATRNGNNTASNRAVTQSYNQSTGGNGGNANSTTVTRSGRGGDALTGVANACCPNGSASSTMLNPGGGVLAGSQGGNSGDATTDSNTQGGDGGNATAGSYGVNASPQTNIQITGNGDNDASNHAVTQSYNRAEGGDGGDADSDITTRSGRGGDALTGVIGGCCSDGPADNVTAERVPRGGGGGGILALAEGGDSGDATTDSNTQGGDGGDATAGSFGINHVEQNDLQGPALNHETDGVRTSHKGGNHDGRPLGGDNTASNEAKTQSFNESNGGDGGDADSDITTRSGRGGDALNLVQSGCCEEKDNHSGRDCCNKDSQPASAERMIGDSGRGGVLALAEGGDSGDATTDSNTQGGNGGDAKAGSFGINSIEQNNRQGGERDFVREASSVSSLPRNGNHDGGPIGGDNRASNRATTQSFNQATGGDGGDANSDITTRSGRGGDAVNLIQAACCPDDHQTTNHRDRDGCKSNRCDGGRDSQRGGGILALAHGGDSGDATTHANTQGGDGGDATAGSFGVNSVRQNNVQGAGGDLKKECDSVARRSLMDRNHEGGDNQASNVAKTQSFNRAQGGDGGDANSVIETRSGRGGDAGNLVVNDCCGSDNHPTRDCCHNESTVMTAERVVGMGGRGGILALAHGGDSGDATTDANTQGGDGGDAIAGSFGRNTVEQNNLQGGSGPPTVLSRSFDENHEGDGNNQARNRATTQSFNEAKGGDGGDADSDIITRSGRGGDASNLILACCREAEDVVK
jgi:hypothetical protein